MTDNIEDNIRRAEVIHVAPDLSAISALNHDIQLENGIVIPANPTLAPLLRARRVDKPVSNNGARYFSIRYKPTYRGIATLRLIARWKPGVKVIASTITAHVYADIWPDPRCAKCNGAGCELCQPHIVISPVATEDTALLPRRLRIYRADAWIIGERPC